MNCGSHIYPSFVVPLVTVRKIEPGNVRCKKSQAALSASMEAPMYFLGDDISFMLKDSPG